MDERERQRVVEALRLAQEMVDEGLGVMGSSVARDQILVNLVAWILFQPQRQQTSEQASGESLKTMAEMMGGLQKTGESCRADIAAEVARDLTRLAAEKGTRWTKQAYRRMLGLVVASMDYVENSGNRPGG